MDKRLMRRFVLVGLGLAILAYILSSVGETLVAGLVFIAMIILGAIGVFKLFKR